MAKKVNRGRSPDNLSKYVGRVMKFYDLKNKESVQLPVKELAKYPLARKVNRARSRGRCSVIAFAKRGKRRVSRSLGIFDCAEVKHLKSGKKPKKRSQRKV